MPRPSPLHFALLPGLLCVIIAAQYDGSLEPVTTPTVVEGKARGFMETLNNWFSNKTQQIGNATHALGEKIGSWMANTTQVIGNATHNFTEGAKHFFEKAFGHHDDVLNGSTPIPPQIPV